LHSTSSKAHHETVTDPVTPADLDSDLLAVFAARVGELRDRLWLEIPEEVRLEIRQTLIHVLAHIVPRVPPIVAKRALELGPGLVVLRKVYSDGDRYLTAAIAQELPELGPVLEAVARIGG
jgi:hypothetical protein